MMLLIYVILFYVCVVITYRLYFHPISKFPGPKLAAITSLYEFYFNAIKGGRFIWEIERLHDQYGPVVRITPHELHINDPCFYTEIYAGHTRRREKDPRFARIGGFPTSMAMTVDHNLHNSRRAILNNYFSKKSILSLQTLIQSKADKLAERLNRAYLQDTIIQLDAAFSATTADIISKYAYGISLDYLDAENFQNDVRESMLNLFSLNHVLKFLPFLLTIAEAVPERILQKLSTTTAKVLPLKAMVRGQARVALETNGNARGRKTIFQALTESRVPPEERTLTRLQDEGFALLGAGTETTAGTLKLIFFHLLHNKTLLLKLRHELDKCPKATWVELEGLPYMRGVINEGLRLSGVIARFARCAPDESLKYREWTIPPGIMISQSSYFVHMNPQLFPAPHSFDPERWIRAQANGERLERLFVPFSKGSRQCLGMNLALAELYLVVATLVRRFDMHLHGTTVEDIATYREYTVGFPKARNNCLSVFVTRDLSA